MNFGDFLGIHWDLPLVLQIILASIATAWLIHDIIKFKRGGRNG